MIKKFLMGMAAVAVLTANMNMAVQAEKVSGLSSLSAVLYEPVTGRVLYEKDAHTARPMASTTKIMTALIAVENFPLDKVVTVSAEAVRVEGSALGLRGGDQITILDLVTGLLLESGNDAANTIAYTVSGSISSFAKRMNERAQKIGMKDTVFVTPSGLDAEGHSSTAYDMALLAAEALKNETIASISDKQSAVIRFGNPPHNVTVQNHNRLLQLYSYAIGMKTGFTKKSGRCLVSAAENKGMRLIAVTLNAGDDWNDHIALYEYGFSMAEAIQLSLPSIPEISMVGAEQSKIKPACEQSPEITLLKGDKDKIQIKVIAPRFLLAPVERGQVVGSVEYWLEDTLICSSPLTAQDDIQARPVVKGWKKYRKLFQTIFIELIH